MDLREEIKRALGADTAAVLSAPKRKDQAFRIKVRAVQMRGQELFQASIYQGTQVFHQNCDADCMAGLLQQWITEDFGQLQLEGCGYSVHVLSSRKGKLTVKSRRKEKPGGEDGPSRPQPAEAVHPPGGHAGGFPGGLKGDDAPGESDGGPV